MYIWASLFVFFFVFFCCCCWFYLCPFNLHRTKWLLSNLHRMKGVKKETPKKTLTNLTFVSFCVYWFSSGLVSLRCKVFFLSRLEWVCRIFSCVLLVFVVVFAVILSLSLCFFVVSLSLSYHYRCLSAYLHLACPSACLLFHPPLFLSTGRM